MSTQHLVLGKRIDFITGKIIVDTHNERVRQIIAKILINEKGFLKNDIELKRKIEINIEGNKGIVNVDFIVRVNGKVFMVIIFGPGSLDGCRNPRPVGGVMWTGYAGPEWGWPKANSLLFLISSCAATSRKGGSSEQIS